MKLKCRIHGKDYEMVQGVPFSEELNETLDSVSIIIPVVEGEIEDLRPYDDVYIYDADKTFNGVPFDSVSVSLDFYIVKLGNYEVALYSPIFKDNFFEMYSRVVGVENTIQFVVNNEVFYYYFKKDEKGFYLENKDATEPKRLDFEVGGDLQSIYIDVREFGGTVASDFIVQNQTIEFKGKKPSLWYKHFLIDQFSYEVLNIEQNTRKYTIDLFSETKGLETVQLPNTPITSPMNLNGSKSALLKMIDFLELYSPKIKVEKNILLKDCEEWEFRQKYSLDADSFTEYNNILNFDMSFNLPSLRDVLTQITLIEDKIPVVKDNVIYALDLSKKGDAFQLEQTELVNLAGSRSSENHADILKRTHSQALSQDYSARRVQYLGFRNSDNALMTFENMRLEFTDELYNINRILMCYYKKANVEVPTEAGTTMKTEFIFLCKQDITPLVLLSAKRNVLSEDWEKLGDDIANIDFEELAKYKLMTLGYNIGSRTIEGWGNKYSYLTGIWFSTTKTYIENILDYMDAKFPYGIYTKSHFKKIYNLPVDAEVGFTATGVDAMITHSDFEGVAKLKGLFFEVDANVFFNGATISTKDDATRDDLVANDNSSSSLTVLEKDGIFQKSKVNRFGNEALVIQTRITDISRLQPLGSVYGDFIIYHREYSIYDNFISCIYYATKNYVLKNYYTSVFSKLRPFSIATYDESVSRAENKVTYLLLSKNKMLFEKNLNVGFNNFENINNKLLSAFIPSIIDEKTGVAKNEDKINYGFVRYDGTNYATDVNAFSYGNSLCFNLKTFDNVSMGVYISKPAPFNPFVDNNTEDDYTGSLQGWYLTSNEIGEVDTMGFYVAHKQDDPLNLVILADINNIYNELFALPKIEENPEKALTNIIGKEYNVRKDNKSLLDMTFQFEPVCDADVVVGNMFLKLSDLITNYEKNELTTTVSIQTAGSDDFKIITGAWCSGQYLWNRTTEPLIAFALSPEMLTSVKTEFETNGEYLVSGILELSKNGFDKLDVANRRTTYYKFEIKKITSISDDYIEIEGKETQVVESGLWWFIHPVNTYEQTRKFKLTRTTSYGTQNNILPADKVYFFSRDYVNPKLDENKIYYVDVFGNKISMDYYFYARDTGDKKLNFDFEGNGGSPIISPETTKQTNAGKYLETIKTFEQNMFVVYSKDKINKTTALEDKLEIESASVDFEEVFTLENGNIKVNLVNAEYKSVQYWFFDDISQTYKFVFGINPTLEEMQQGYAIIYCSLVSTRDERVFGWNNEQIGKVLNFVGSRKTLDKQYIERFIK